MAPTSTILARMHQKRAGNWAQREAGVIVVFCVVFIVASGLIGLFLSRLITRKRAERAVKKESQSRSKV